MASQTSLIQWASSQMRDPVSKANRHSWETTPKVDLWPPHTCTWAHTHTRTHSYTHAYMHAHTHIHARIHTPPTKSCMTVISSCSLSHPFLSLLSSSSLYTLLIPMTFQALSHPQCLCTPLGVLLYLEWFFPHSVQSKILVVKPSTVRSVHQGSSANWPS